MSSSRVAAVRAGAVFGFGLGGLVDGVVLHQVLQWHHLVSDDEPTNTVRGLEVNTRADGVFHLAVLAILVLGAVLLWRASVSGREDGHRAVAGTLLGWGAFHVVDEVVFHVLLDLHHIRMVDDFLVYDLAFTLIGLVLIGLGWSVLRRGRSGAARAGP